MATFIEKTIDINGSSREYFIHHPKMPTEASLVPQVITGFTSYPVIMAFHGGTPNEARDAMTDYWDCVADHHLIKDDIIVICPKAELKEGTGKYSWQQATPYTDELPLQDLNFIEELLDLYQADPDKSYAAGFSSGAGMTWQLLYVDRLIDRFVGYGMVSQAGSNRKEELGDASAMEKAKPVIYIHGTADDNWVRFVEIEEVAVVEKMPPDMMRDLIVRNNTKSTPERVDVIAIDRDMAAVEQFFVPESIASQVSVFPPSLPLIKIGEPFSYITLLNTGHNWSRDGGTPPVRITTFSATVAIFNFWVRYAGLVIGHPPVSPLLTHC